MPKQPNNSIRTLIQFKNFIQSLSPEGEEINATSTMPIDLTSYEGQFLIYNPNNTEQPFYFTEKLTGQVLVLLKLSKKIPKDKNKQHSKKTTQDLFREAIEVLIDTIQQDQHQPFKSRTSQESILNTSFNLQNKNFLEELLANIRKLYSRQDNKNRKFINDLVINAIANQTSFHQWKLYLKNEQYFANYIQQHPIY